MNSKTKFTLMVTAMVAVTLLAVVGIMAVFAARQQTFNTSITVVYKSTNVEGSATAQWKLGSYYDYGDGDGYWDFYGDEWHDMDSNGADNGGNLELDLSAAGPLSLSPSQPIDLSDEYPGVVLKYTFTNSATHPYTLNFKYQSNTETKNIISFYMATSQAIEDYELENISNNFIDTLETTVLGETTENIYILLKINDLGSDSSFDGTFNIKLDGITNNFTEDYVYLYDGTNAILTGVVDKEATTFDASTITYKGAPVTAIGDGVFQNNTYLQTVTLNGIEKIGANSFSGCTAVTELTIGDDVSYIGGNAFVNLTHLTKLNFNAINATLGQSSNGLFNSAGSEDEGIIAIFGDKVKTIPEDLLRIGGGPSSFYPKVINFTIGQNVEAIGGHSISGQNVTCDNLFIPKSVKSIGESAFSYQNISNIQVEQGNVVYTSRDIKGNECNAIIDIASKTLMAGCKNTEIPNDNSVDTIGASAFSNCQQLVNIQIPDNIIKIEGMAFYSCTGLLSVGMGNQVEIIGRGAFEFCTQLTSITIPENVKSIGNQAFDFCNSLTNVTIKSKEVCDNLLSWEAGGVFETATELLECASIVNAKYEIVGLEEQGFTKSDALIDGYWVYTKIS